MGEELDFCCRVSIQWTNTATLAWRHRRLHLRSRCWRWAMPSSAATSVGPLILLGISGATRPLAITTSDAG
jgi:hypothetical protein